MTSPAMVAQFERNHDGKDPHAGIAYAKTMQLCIGSTQDKAACFDLYTQWLEGDVQDKENLLLRALILNLDKTAGDIASAMKVGLDWWGFPLDGLIGSDKKGTGNEYLDQYLKFRGQLMDKFPAGYKVAALDTPEFEMLAALDGSQHPQFGEVRTLCMGEAYAGEPGSSVA